MSTLLMSLPPKERREILRATHTPPSERDAKMQRIATKVDELEEIVAALRDLIDDGGNADEVAHRD